MSGAPDPVYVRARRVLLDALEALGEQRRAVVLVGAQAVYLRVGEADFAVAPYTEDADLALIPEFLLDLPVLAEALAAANFTSDQPGIWTGASGGTVDLLVPEALGGSGRRGARLGSPHGDKVARKVKGIEGALVDQKTELIGALVMEDASPSHGAMLDRQQLALSSKCAWHLVNDNDMGTIDERLAAVAA